MDWKQFWGSALLVGFGGSIFVLSNPLVGLVLIGVGLWYGPFQGEFWDYD